MIRVLNTLLLLIAIVGVYFVAQASTKFEATRSEYARLTAKVGRLPIEDATKVHVLALVTDDPLDFAWRVYTPAKFYWKQETADLQGGVSSSSGMQQDARTEIFRVRFRKIDDRWIVWTKMIGGSGATSVREAELLDQPELLRIQQLGLGKVRVIEPDEVVTLLSITAELPSSSGDGGTRGVVNRFGSKDAWAKQQNKGQ